jgi:dTMP kinase
MHEAQAQASPPSGKFITFEGIDGSGKSTQLQFLAQWLEQREIPVLRTRQPGGTAIGQEIRKILLNPEHQELCNSSEMLLYLADRIQHLQETILPALHSGKWVLCDRFHDSTVAYQGYGRGLDLSGLESVVKREIMPYYPEVTFWFDASPEVALARLQRRQQDPDRLDRESLEFFERVRNGFAREAEASAQRVIRIDAEATPEAIQNQVIQCVFSRYPSIF